jgi:hypothetical protein
MGTEGHRESLFPKKLRLSPQAEPASVNALFIIHDSLIQNRMASQKRLT